MHREGEGIRLFQNLFNYLSLDMTSYPRAVLFNRWCAEGRLLVELVRNLVAHGDAREGK